MKKLRRMGTKNAIITLGGRGCAYYRGDEVVYAGVFDVKKVDTTAAGDSFIGGLCAAFCDGKEIGEAVYYASATASITISRAGAAVSIPTSDEVKDFLSKNKMLER